MTRTVMTYASRKGGVGKTSLTIATADELASRGETVLVIDLDPQANATTWLGVTGFERSMNDVLYASEMDGVLGGAIVESPWPRVLVAPAEERLASREKDVVPAADARLRRVLRTTDLTGVDTVLIDPPPGLGALLLNALGASDRVVVVTDAERGGGDGAARTLEAARIVAEDAHPALRVAGLVMNRHEASVKEHQLRWAELRELYGELVLGLMPKRAAVGTAFGASVPPRRISGSFSFITAVSDLVDRLQEEKGR